MKIKQILVTFLFTALVISCGNKAKDIDVKELETECDVVDAMEIVTDELIALVEAVYSEEGDLKEQMEEFKSLGEKAQEILKQADELGFKLSEEPDCPNVETLKKKTENWNENAPIIRRIFTNLKEK